MRRRAVFGSVLTGLATGSLGARPRPTATQASAAAPAHPIVGAWRIDIHPGNPDSRVAYGLFHADGTGVTQHPIAGTGIGVWRATGERAGALTIKYLNIANRPGAFVPGTATVRAEFDVDEAGRAFSLKAIVEVRAADGALTGTSHFEWTGSRLEVEPIGTIVGPAAATPTG